MFQSIFLFATTSMVATQTHLSASWLASRANVTVSHSMVGCSPGWTDKNNGSPIATALSVDVSPSFTLAKGASYTYTAGYTMGKTVTGGQAAFKTTLSGIPIMNSKEDLCDSLKDSPTPCPLNAGPVRLTSPPPTHARPPRLDIAL